MPGDSGTLCPPRDLPERARKRCTIKPARAALAFVLAALPGACSADPPPERVEREQPASAQAPRETTPTTASAAKQTAPKPEWKPERLRYDPTRVQRLLRAPFPEWTSDDKTYAETIGVKAMFGEFGIADRKRLGTALYTKWFEHSRGLVTREEQQAIAERIARAIPEEFAAHVIGVEGWDGGFTVTLRPEVQDVWWSIECDLKRGILEDLVQQWQEALHAAQRANGLELDAVEVVVRTEQGELAHWNERTGATVSDFGTSGELA